MDLAPSGISLSFEVTFESPGLSVGFSFFDDSGVTPVLVQGPTLALNVVGNTYRAKFPNATAGKSYLVFKAVYTDNTLTTIDSSFPQGSDTIVAEDLNTINADDYVIGLVDATNDVVGFVDGTNDVIGLIDC